MIFLAQKERELTLTNYTCDLHAHTTNSDGKATVNEFLDRAKLKEMDVVAITDHDIKPPSAHHLKGKGVGVVQGIEFSCDTNLEDVHILCFGVDFEHENIEKIIEVAGQSKIEAYVELVSRLSKRYPDKNITIEEIIKDNNVTLAELQKKMIFEYMEKKGIVSSWDEGKIIVQSDNYLTIKRQKPEPQLIIETIKELGGITVLAHPYLIELEHSKRKKYIEKLIDMGLDGLEACYTYEKTSYKGSLTSQQIETQIKEDYSDVGVFFTGGSDSHGEWKIKKEGYRDIGDGGISMDELKKLPIYQYVIR